MAGMMTAALLSYALGRSLSRDKVRRLAGAKLNRLSRQLRRRGILGTLLIHIVPIAPYVIVNMVSGAARVRVRDFSIGTAIALLPGTLATTIFGDQMEAALRDPGEIDYGLIALAAIIIVAVFIAARHWLKSEETPTNTTQNVVERG